MPEFQPPDAWNKSGRAGVQSAKLQMLEARSLTKYYGHTAVVDHVSFQLRPGEILGYLGPNGAGKSTTVKMLTGLIEPSEGQIFYQCRTVYEDLAAFQRRIGYVPEEAHLYPHLSGREHLQLIGRLRGLPRRVLEPKVDEFLRVFGLWEDSYTPLSSYSKGMRQKILLSAALLHNPEILILDEPFSGLDVTSALVLRGLLDALAGRGKLILYSSHVLEVVEKVCSKVLILRKGQVVGYGSIGQLRELSRQPSLEAVFAQLAQVEDGNDVARRILDIMDYEGRPLRPARATAAAPPSQAAAAVVPNPEESRNAFGLQGVQRADEAAESARRRHGVVGLLRLLLSLAIRQPLRFVAESGRDIPHALRALAGSPGFTLVALVSLSLGICIATCGFTQISGIALRTLPAVRNANELVALQLPTSFPAYKRYRGHTNLFSDVGAYIAPVPFGVALGGHTERVWGHLVTPSYFSTFGVRPFLGRIFDKEEELPSQTPAVVVSHRFWQERLASDAAIVGKTLRINSRPSVVIGVGPKGFLGASPMLFGADLWVPVFAGGDFAPELADNALEKPDRNIFRVVGRLKPGFTTPQAEAELDAAVRHLAQDYGQTASHDRGRRVLLVEGGKLLPLRKQDLPLFTSFSAVLVGLIMLIACSNVASMMLARASGRRREIAVRLALGAGAARIVRQLLTESILVSLGAALPGFVGSVILMRLLAQVRMPFTIPVTFDLRPDGLVLLVTVALSILTGLAFGLAPALQAARADLASALKGGANVQFQRYRRLSVRNVLMVAQFASSLTLLAILGMLALGIQTTMGLQAGFNPSNLYLLSLDPIRDGYSGAQATAFFQRLLDRVKTLPSVTAACITETVPVSLPGGAVKVSTTGETSRAVVSAVRHVVGKDYFETAGIPILLGRGFRQADERDEAASMIVSQQLVRQLWKGADPLGRRMEIGDGEVVAAKLAPGSYDYRRGSSGNRRSIYEVVGVAGDVAEGLVVQKTPRPAVYLPLRTSEYVRPAPEGVTLIMRATPGSDVRTAVLREIAAIDANVTPFNVRSMQEQIGQFTAPLRSASWTYGLMGIFGLVLASVGLAGMTAYSVNQRWREIGIRMALGARRSHVLGLVMNDGFILVALGTALGLAGAWAGSRMLAGMNASVGQVTSTSTADPRVMLGAPLLLGALALVACYLPARRSMQVDPVVALRQE